MGRKAKELSAIVVSRLREPGMHFVGGVAGLALLISPTGGKSWILRVMVGGKRRDMGLGGYPEITLAMAREKARTARDKVRNGIDPIDEAQAAKDALIASRKRAITFKVAAQTYIADKCREWRNPKHLDQWVNTLDQYAHPVIGDLIVQDVQQSHVLQVLDPIWREKTETATRLRGRIEKILDWAKVRGYRTGDNPAAWKGHLEMILPNPSKIARTKHFSSMPFQKIGAFMPELRERVGVSPRALEFLILTGVRSGMVRGATWSEIDLDERIWTIPQERLLKTDKEHRVPLADAAIKVLEGLPRFEGSDYIFPNRQGKPLSDMALTKVMRDMKEPYTVHGFRSTFRDWAAERTNFHNHIGEMALAHTIGNKVEAAYRRGDLFAKRKLLMQAWAKYCNTAVSKANIVSLHGDTKKKTS